MTPPTLLHVMFDAEVGGCETTALALAAHLPAVRHRLLVLGRDGPMTERFRAAGAAVVIVPATDRAGRRGLAGVVGRAAEGARAAMLWHGMVRLPPMLRALNRRRVAVGAYGGNPAHTMPRAVDWRYALWHRLCPPAGPLPVFVCCSRYVADSFAASRYLRLFPRAVVHNGVGLPPAPPALPRPYDAETPFRIGMVARLNAIKDHATLIRAVAAVRRRFPNVVLELAGDGELKADLEALAGGLGMRDGVRFLGNVADVYGALAGWDVFVFSTTEREGMGSALAEAMMAGRPCVVSDVGPAREFAGEDGAAVRLVPPADPAALAGELERLIPDRAARQTLADAGRAFAMRRFHPEAFAAAYARHLGLPEPA